MFSCAIDGDAKHSYIKCVSHKYESSSHLQNFWGKNWAICRTGNEDQWKKLLRARLFVMREVLPHEGWCTCVLITLLSLSLARNLLHILLLVAVTRAEKLPGNEISDTPKSLPSPLASTQEGASSYSSYNAEGAGMYGQTTKQAPFVSSFYGVPVAAPSTTTTTTTPRPATTPMSYGPAPTSAAPATPPGSLPYPSYTDIPPDLSFTCTGRLDGYYADPEAQCQVWHWCVPGGYKYSFLCPIQTLFNQATRTCDWWYNVDCQTAASLYGNNAELYKV